MLGFFKRLFSAGDMRCPQCRSLSVIVAGGDNTKYICTDCKARLVLADGKLTIRA